MMKLNKTQGQWFGFVGAIVLLTIIQSTTIAMANSLGGVKPTDMIESWKYFPGKGPTLTKTVDSGSSDIDLPLIEPNQKKITFEREVKPITGDVSDISPVSFESTPVRLVSNKDVKPIVGQDLGLVDVKDVTKENIEDSMIRIPAVDDSSLTRLITSNKQPTFVQEKFSKPVINPNIKGDSKVLATYRILVPIWIPAVKKKPTPVKVRQQQTVEYVKEKHTEMVPVTKQVTVKKTIIKAEPVPQKVITDFVKKEPFSPTDKDDAVKPREEILDTVVTKFNS